MGSGVLNHLHPIEQAARVLEALNNCTWIARKCGVVAPIVDPDARRELLTVACGDLDLPEALETLVRVLPAVSLEMARINAAVARLVGIQIGPDARH